MNLDELNQQRLDATVAASTQARTVAIAGLGVVWLFSIDYLARKSTTSPSNWLLGAGSLFAAALLLDLFQLVARAVALDVSYKRANSDSDDTEDVDVGPEPELWTRRLFFAKFVPLLLGYGSLIIFIITRLGR